MIHELDVVALIVDLPEEGLKEGDTGTVVHDHSGQAFIVEFMDEAGYTTAMPTLLPEHVRLVRSCNSTAGDDNLARPSA